MVGVNFQIADVIESVDNLIPRPTWVFGVTALGFEARSRAQAPEMAWLTAIVGQETGQVFAAYVSVGLPEPPELAGAIRPQLAPHVTSVLRPRVLRVETEEVSLPDSIRTMLARCEIPIDDQLTCLPGINPIEMVADLMQRGVLGREPGFRGFHSGGPACAAALNTLVLEWLKGTYHRSPLQPFAQVRDHHYAGTTRCGAP